MVRTHLSVVREPYRVIHQKKSSYNTLESECGSATLLHSEVTALRHVDIINITRDMRSESMGMERVGSKWFRLKCSRIALRHHTY